MRKKVKVHLIYKELDNGKEPHLYFTSDEEIKEGDWYVDSIIKNKVIAIKSRDLMDSSYYKSKLCRKIVATTDPILENIEEKSGGNNWARALPKIPQSFIEAYANTPVEEVELEYEEIGTGIVRFPSLAGDMAEYIGLSRYKLKLTPNNEVIVHFIEEKMYSRDEVQEAIIKIVKEISLGDYHLTHHHNLDFRNAKEWIKENLN
jgi:hypothetical protein